MKYVFSILFLVTVVVVFSCRKDVPVVSQSNTNSSDCAAMQLYSPQDTNSYPLAAYTITSAKVEGDYLKLTVSYGGGCAEHDFKLVWNQLAMPAFDVVVLSQNAHGDMCKALITKNLCFNISLLRGTSTHGQTQFPLSDPEGHTFQIKYVY